MSEDWQPIETAPQDGSWILLCTTDGKMAVCTWDKLSYNWEKQWVYGPNGHEHSFRSGFYEATHWKPLPTPPHC
jgi:hypothetical protein